MGTLEQKLQERTEALKTAQAEEPTGSNIAWLKKNVVKLRTELQGLKMELEDAEASQGKTGFNPTVFDVVELNTDLPENAELRKAVDALESQFPSLKTKGLTP